MQSGITLIALVITVIVLLILAGTAITLSINGGNLFSKTNEAANEWNTAVEREETAVKNVLSVLDDLSPSPVTVSTNFPVGWNDKNQLSKVAIAGGRTVPIPTGFVVSEIEGENTISGGLVIYEGTTAVTTANHDDAMETRDQFVWIPVDDINSMVMCKKNNTTYTNENEEEVPARICNIVYDETNDTIKCTVHNSEDICGRLYTVKNVGSQTVNGSDVPAYVSTQEFNERIQTWSTTSYREPDTATDTNFGDASTNGIAGINKILGTSTTSWDEIKTTWENELTNSFIYMAKSVAKYGGFYISRYEIGGTADTNEATLVTSRKGQTILNAGSYSSVDSNGNVANLGGLGNWYGLYKACRVTTTNNNTTQYNRIMIWDSQYDQVMKFIEEGSAKVTQIGHPNNFINVNWSNYFASNKFKKYAKSAELGDPDMKNVYDLENNFYELTASAYSTNTRALRGGNFRNVPRNGFYVPAAYREYIYSIISYNFVSTRTTLLVTL